jgi:hypothetical protein
MGYSLSKASNPPKEHEKHAYSIPIMEVDLFRRITRSYARRLGIMLTAPLVPHKRVRKLCVTKVDNHIIIQTLESFFDSALCETNGPISIISLSHPNS